MELEKLKTIIGEVMNIPTETIEPQTTFVDDLGADSLDIFQIIMTIEEVYDVEIDDQTAEQIHTVSDAVSAIRRKMEC